MIFALRSANLGRMWIFYHLLFPVAFALLAPFYFWKMARRGNWRLGFWQRFGLYGREFGPVDVWVQAVSVGEVGIAKALIAKLHARNPSLRVVLTTTTSTGQVEARKMEDPNVAVGYFPLDWAPITARALARFRPKLFVIVETEIWPSAIRLSKARGTAVALVNGRISDRSYRWYSMLSILFRPLFGTLDLALTQSEAEAQRFLVLGARSEAVAVTGQVKFDLGLGGVGSGDLAWRILDRCGVHRGQRIWVSGSTFAGEEDICLRVAKKLREKFPDLFLVLVPRHAERAAEVAAMAKRAGLRLTARSVVEFGEMKGAEGLLVDTTGELCEFYKVASVVFVGKSLTAHGGQNPIEPAAEGKAILVGPHTENFRDVLEEFRAADAVVEVADEAGLAAALERLLADEAARQRLGQRAKAVVERNRGALERTVEKLESFLSR